MRTLINRYPAFFLTVVLLILVWAVTSFRLGPADAVSSFTPGDSVGAAQMDGSFRYVGEVVDTARTKDGDLCYVVVRPDGRVRYFLPQFLKLVIKPSGA